MKLETAFVLLVLGLACIAPSSYAEDEAGEERDYRYGSVRLGVFWVGQINHSVVARSPDLPVGVFIDLSEDFGLDVSFEDEVLAAYRQNYRGAIAFFGVHF
jgi:hypothetical protein